MRLLKTTNVLLLGVAMAVGYACDEKRLDLQPLSPTEASYFTEEADFTKAVLGVYAKINDFYWFNNNNPIHGVWQLPGDDITTSGTEAFEIFGTLQPSNGGLNTFYRITYQLINRANTTLQKIDQEKGIYKTANLKTIHRGEALLLRGYGYYLLWNYFGTAPLVTERIQSSDKITPTSSKDTELLDQAIKDFTEAATLLPATWSDANRGRVTQNTANGFLGKALVFRGSAKKSTADMAAAVTAFAKISSLKLMDNFSANFDVKFENNSESLFEFQASQPGFDNVWLPNDFESGGVGSTSTYWGFYENHWSLFGKPPYIATQKLADAFEKDDPRIAATLNPTSKVFNKYWNTGDQKSQSGVASVNNPRILRLADVILLRAEAVLESGGSTAEAIGLINQIRTRARLMKKDGTVPADYPTTETDKAKIFNWIMMERFRELAGEEGARWLDLRRWQMAGKVNLSGFNWSSIRNDVSFDPAKHTVFPIPTSEIDLNPNVKQNPGY